MRFQYFIMKQSFILAGLIGCLLTVNGAPAATLEDRLPNLLVFLVDDMGWQDTSVPFWKESTPLNRHFRTPSMERLARQGTKFINAYASCVCSPTRTSIMNGQNAVRHQVTNWTLYPDKDTSHETDRLKAPSGWNRNGLQPDQALLPVLLQKKGYVTIHVGKAHWGAIGTRGSDPLNLGFMVNIGGHSAGGPGHYHGQKNYGNKQAGEHTLPWGIPGLEAYHGGEMHLTDALTVEAGKAVGKAVKARKPFYLYMAHYAVHAPIQPHQRLVKNYQGKKYPGTDLVIPPQEINYASMVEGMDESLGSLLAILEELGVAEETLVVFASDNGGLSLHARGMGPRGTGRNTHCWPLREGKGSAYEGGTRIPFMVSWAKPDPDNPLQKTIPIRAGGISSAHLIIEDLYPTLLKWAGITPPPSAVIDGRDFTADLAHPQNIAVARPLVFHYPHQWTGKPVGGYQPHSSLRLGDWKVIYFYENQLWELYNVEEDIGETVNRADENPEILRRMALRLVRELEKLGAQYPENKMSGNDERPILPLTTAQR
jgi:arylsulfatase A-like enzyme